MRTIYQCFFRLCIIAWLSSSAAIHAQDSPATVRVKLSLAGNKALYRIGEPIRLILEFTADGSGYQVDTVPDRSEPTSDSITVSPDSGVHPWLDEYTGRYRPGRCVFSLAQLSASPTRVEVLLNESIRFDRAGKYSVKVTTRRVVQAASPVAPGPPLVLTTNEVSFEVQPMSDAEEEKEVKRLSDLLDAAREWQAEEKVTHELSFLTGDASSREKVRRFLNSEGRSGNYHRNINYGLFIGRNRALILQLLEAAMRDPKTPVTYALLSTVVKLRMLETYGGMPEKSMGTVTILNPLEDPQLRAIQNAYLTELAAGLGRRVGKSQTTTAMTILMHLPKEPTAASTMLGEVRRLILEQFDALHPFDQEYLLRVFWDQLRDPSLVPSLKKMLDYGGVANRNIHDAALRRLIEAAPDEARPYVVSEIRKPNSLVDLEILMSLSDKSLPEIDQALLSQIRRFASSKENFGSVYLKQKTSLAARYASVGIYGDLMQIYRSPEAKLPLESRAAFLAYFARHNEREALPLIEQALEGLEPGQDFNLLPQLTRLYFSDAINALLVKRLEMNEPQAASHAAYLISLHGPAGSEKVLESRLERWRKEWGTRASEAETNLQGSIESELIQALTRGKLWKLSAERVKELQQSCLTRLCRQTFPAP